MKDPKLGRRGTKRKGSDLGLSKFEKSKPKRK